MRHGSADKISLVAAAAALGIKIASSSPTVRVLPRGQRISGERRTEADERVRCMRVLGHRLMALKASTERQAHHCKD